MIRRFPVTCILLLTVLPPTLVGQTTPAPTSEAPPTLRGPHHEIDMFPAIVFAPHEDGALDFEFFRPRGAGPFPAVLVIPGGAWRIDYRWSLFAKALAREGVAAAAMITRKAPAHGWRHQMDDCRRGLQFLRAHAEKMGIDGQRIGVVGLSSGGHLAALLSTEGERREPKSEDPVARQSTRPACTVTFCAPSDLVLRKEPVLGPAEQAELLADFLGLDVDRITSPTGAALDVARAASPTWQASADDPPMLVVHGAQDHIVPVRQGRRLQAALERAGIDHEYVELEDARHLDYLHRFTRDMTSFRPEREHPAQEEIWNRTRAFLRRHLLEPRRATYGFDPVRDARRLTEHRFKIKKDKGIVFVKRGDRTLKLDLYRPKTPGPHPVMLVLHGGGWRMGRRNFGDAPAIARALASRGVAAAAASYRLAPAHPHPAQYEDALAALDFIRANANQYDLDPTRCGSIGLSAGGHLSALIGCRPGAERAPLRAAVSLSGVLTLEGDEDYLNRFQKRLIYDFLGGEPRTEKEKKRILDVARDASPTAHADEFDTPLHIVHAKNDAVVPFWSAQEAMERFRSAGLRYGSSVLEKGNHGFYLLPLFTQPDGKGPDFLRDIEEFLARRLLDRPRVKEG